VSTDHPWRITLPPTHGLHALPDSVHETAGDEESPSPVNRAVPARTWGMCPVIGPCRRGTIWDLEGEGEDDQLGH
jgi:hypothetical protein